MKKILKKSFVFFLIISSKVLFSQQNNNSEKLRFSGFIGRPGNAPLGLMKSSVPEDTVRKECTFFSGDSLEGFDFNLASTELDKNGYKLYFEFKNMMYQEQAKFIKNKFNLSEFPIVSPKLKHVEPKSVLVSACANLDFEDGNFTNWIKNSGYNTNSNGNLTIPAGGANAAVTNTNQTINHCSEINLITSTYGNDPLGFPGLDPQGGSYSARLGGFHINTCGFPADGFNCDNLKWDNTFSQGEMLEQTFAVTSSNALISYDYAVVLNDGGHANGAQPYFHVFIKNSSGAILSSCTQYYIQASSGTAPPGFINSGFVNSSDNSILYYKNWTANSINLTPYIGQTVNLEFVSAGCTAGGHMAWAYVDVTCGPAEVIEATNTSCSTNTISLTAPAGGTYLWSGSGVNGLTTQSVSVNTSGTYTVVVTPTQGAACTYTLTKSITIGAQSPTVTATASNTLTCNTTTVSLAGTGGGTYSWGGPGIVSGSATSSPVVNLPGVYTVTVTAAGCTATANVTVTQNTLTPPVSATSTNSLTCSTLTASINGGPAAGVTYQWAGTGIQGSTTSQNIVVNAPGVYSLTVTGTNGCTNATFVTVPQNTLIPTTTASTSGILTCNNFTVGLNSTLSGMNYTWTAPSGGSVTSSSTQTTVANGVGNYTLAVINPSNGCTYTTTTTVTQNTATPVLSAGPSQTLTCASPSVALNGTVSTPANPTVNWTGPSVCGAATNVTTQVCSAGIYTLTATDPLNGCVNTSTVEVYPNLGAPTATISSNSLVLNCITLSQTATVTSTPNTDVTYSWNTAPASLTANGTIATFTSNGTYVCTVTNTITNCSITTQVVVTTNNTPPTINITPTQTISCANPTAIITLTTIPTSGLTYTWGPTPVSGQGTNSVLVNQANIYTVTVTDAANGCTNTATSEIISDANVPSASINVTSSNTIITCSNPSVTLTASVTPNATYSYTWIPSGSSSSINVTSATVYTVIALNSITGCTTFATYNVLSNTTPPNLVANNAIIPCNSTSVNVAATSTNNAVSYNWSTTNGNLLTNGTGTVAVGSTGSYVVTATDLDNGCTNTATATVSQSTISAGFIANPVYGTAPLVVDFTNQSNGASSYTWVFGDGNTSTSINPTNTYTMIGVYIVTLTAVDASGSCVSTSTISIEVIDNSLIEVPNVFTPNGDGSNEVFKIKTKAIKELTCEIYNRWGLKLYTITSPSDYWDGSGYSAGTYYYILNAKGYDGKEYKDHGFLSLFK